MSAIQNKADFEEVMRLAQDAMQARIWTSLPAIIESFDPAKMTCSMQPAISSKVTRPDGTLYDLPLPLLVDCPVIFPRGGGFTLTFPVKNGDECLAMIASRCIDAWWQSGGVQPQAELRMHDLSDGFALIGPFSQVTKIDDISTVSVQLRSNDGSTFVEVHDGQMVKITAPGGINLNGVTISAAGVVNAPGEGTFNGHTVGAHTHDDPQGGTTSPPTG